MDCGLGHVASDDEAVDLLVEGMGSNFVGAETLFQDLDQLAALFDVCWVILSWHEEGWALDMLN